ncbi:MAG: hypothetical protein OEY80_03645 [Nitrospirota bacterium]|nr:hypothetical protein [Nitrospirota bacterium]MDH5574559.1 hypothetical protein [Nitrospirota bacterium]
MWWPLAASWMLMGLELPLVAATISRLSDPAVHLAAYGGVVFPLSLLIESPVIMILVASTALCKNWSAYRLIRNFIVCLGVVMTVVHVLVAFTPVYGMIVQDLLGVPEVIVESGRIGLQCMTPWTLSIAVRRFLQGVVIRGGQTRLIGLGTLVRLFVSGSVLLGGLAIKSFSGIVVGTVAMSSGVIVEAGFILLFVRPILKTLKESSPQPEASLTLKQLGAFYWPLAFTPLITLATLPIVSAAISRMPQPLESLAVWPVLGGLSFIFRSVGFAMQEVVVALYDRPHFLAPLRQFVGLVSLGTSGTLLLIAATPLSTIWFEWIAALTPELSVLASTAVWLVVIFPAVSSWESFFQGQLVHRGLTTCITQAVSLYLAGSSLLLFFGVLYGQVTGLYVGLAAMGTGLGIQLWWLWTHARQLKDQGPAPR